MINLAIKPQPRLHRGRVPKRESITTQKAQSMARHLLGNELLSNLAWQFLDVLAEGVVLTDDQLFRLYRLSSKGKFSAFHRTMLRYYHKHLVDAGPRVQALRDVSLPLSPKAKLKTYSLGAVGVQIMAIKGVKAELGLPAFELLPHDLLVNEIVLRLADYQRQEGNSLIWSGKREARLMDDDKIVLEPDAMITIERPDGSQAALIEYHNEDNSRRGAEKIARYENVQRRPELWQAQWQIEEFPPVMVVFRHRAVLTGYRRAITESRRSLRTAFVAKSLADVLAGEGLDNWTPVEEANE